MTPREEVVQESGPSKQLRDKVLDIVRDNKDIDLDSIVTHMKKEVGLSRASLARLVDEILRWWEESGKILQMVDRRTKNAIYRINESLEDSDSEMNEDISLAAPKGKFTKDMIDALRSAYEKINTVNPSSPQYKRLSELLDSLDKEQLKQLANADIKFVSKLALVRINRMKESVTESLAFRLPNEARARKSAEILRRDEVGEVTIKGDMITIEVPCSAGQVGGSSILHSRILEHMRTMGGRFLKGTDGQVSERIFQTIKEDTHVPTPTKLNTSVLRSLNDASSRILSGELGSIEEEIELEEDSHHKPGDIVQVPHKGKMVKGKIVRFDRGGTNKAKQHGGGFIVDVGEPASILVPTHEVQK